MPLEHSGSDAAFKKNVSTLMGEVGKSPHVQSRDQALAIAYATKRRGAKRAVGGFAPPKMPQPSWQERAEARGLSHTGPINSAVPGRTDRHNMNVPSSSYVFPADFISHLGQNNTAAGMSVLGRMGFGGGMAHGAGAPKPVRAPLAASLSDRGGSRGEGQIGKPTPVVTAGGEFVADPESIMRVLGTTDMKHAHNVLDKWVMKVRKDHIKTLKGLPPPAKS